MLQSLHVKNLALIEEAEIELKEGLNILTGETGAGKSILLGSVNLALGAKFDKEMLRTGADSATVELCFTSNPVAKQLLAEMDIEQSEDGNIYLSRKMQVGKSVLRINGEIVSAKQVKTLAESLIDIHGQHEHQSLFQKKNYFLFLDDFCGKELLPIKEQVSKSYEECRECERKLQESGLDEHQRAREQSLAQFEFEEIENARLTEGEDEELEARYQKMIHSKKIVEALSECYRYTSTDSERGAGSAFSRALREISTVTMYDETLGKMYDQLTELDDLLSDFNHDLEEYQKDCEFEEEDFRETEERLNLLNHLKEKYGNTLADILSYREEKQKQLEMYANYDAYMEQLNAQYEKAKQHYQKECDALTKVRQKYALILQEQLRESLVALNFLSVQFEIRLEKVNTFSANGQDAIDFFISTNPGEPLKSLSQVASGGELSRVMLAIKTVLAGQDDIDTLIFDEIDAGISGKTAWKVSEQLHQVSKKHQVICITHLPQIAAMADSHFLIEKSSRDNVTSTNIYELSEKQTMEELARLLGSDELTEAALSNAEEMRKQAFQVKNI